MLKVGDDVYVKGVVTAVAIDSNNKQNYQVSIDCIGGLNNPLLWVDNQCIFIKEEESNDK